MLAKESRLELAGISCSPDVAASTLAHTGECFNCDVVIAALHSAGHAAPRPSDERHRDVALNVVTEASQQR